MPLQKGITGDAPNLSHLPSDRILESAFVNIQAGEFKSVSVLAESMEFRLQAEGLRVGTICVSGWVNHETLPLCGPIRLRRWY